MRSVRPFTFGIFAACLWLWSCSGAQAPGGAANPGGGAVGGSGSSLGSGGAAQPMDSGFSGPQKDIHNIHYLIRDGKARVLCQAGEKSKVRYEGFLINQKPSGEAYPAVGFLGLTDATAGKFLVTRSLSEEGKMGYFQTEMKVSSPLGVSFDWKQAYDGPLETLLDFEAPEGFSIVIPVEPKPELAVEQGPRAEQPCLEKTFEFGIPQEAAAE